MLEPVLERCTPDQLYRIEEYNHVSVSGGALGRPRSDPCPGTSALPPGLSASMPLTPAPGILHGPAGLESRWEPTEGVGITPVTSLGLGRVVAALNTALGTDTQASAEVKERCQGGLFRSPPMWRAFVAAAALILSSLRQPAAWAPLPFGVMQGKPQIWFRPAPCWPGA